MKQHILTYVIAAASFGITSFLSGQNPEIHPMTGDPGGCADCHITSAGGSERNYSLRPDISDHCCSCHEQNATNHPIGIKPPFDTPKDLSLLEDGTMSCATCHNPHSSRYSERPWRAMSLAGRMDSFFNRQKKFKTYFLRRNNAHGDLCLSCHREQPGVTP